MLFARKYLAFAVTASTLLSSPSFASFPHLDPKSSAQAQKSVFAFGIGASTFLISQFGLEVPTACKWCEPSDFDRSISSNSVWSNRGLAATFSDVIAYGVIPSASLFVALFDYCQWTETLIDLFTLANAAFLTHSVTEVFKRAMARARPLSTFGYPVEDVSDEYLSFPSGHTSLSFAFATASSWIAFKRHYAWAPYVAVLGGLSAAATGYLRIAAAKHWFSDVMAGASLGIFIGTVVPLFTFANVSPMPNGDGFTVSWKW